MDTSSLKCRFTEVTPLLIRIVRHVLRGSLDGPLQQDEDELIQQAFLELLLKHRLYGCLIEELVKNAHLVARETRIVYFRKRARAARRARDYIDLDSLSMPSPAACDCEERCKLAKCARDLIERLPETYRSVAIDFFIERHSRRTVARQHGLEEGRVSSIIRTVRQSIGRDLRMAGEKTAITFPGGRAPD